jgi:hypothetical protein
MGRVSLLKFVGYLRSSMCRLNGEAQGVQMAVNNGSARL